jgi:hypothetical protein
MKTTVAHLIAERLEEKGESIEIPDEVKGDLVKEHNWMFFDRDGPMLMSNQRDLFHEVCDEVDKGVEDGTIIFNSEDGTITFN